jgi:hypothetical protein
MMYYRNCGHDSSWNPYEETGDDNICDACWEKNNIEMRAPDDADISLSAFTEKDLLDELRNYPL